MNIQRAIAICVIGTASGCASFTTKLIANALSGPSNLGSDDDPELVRDAAPAGLKAMESVLEAQPHHKGLLVSLASGFTQYAYAFVQADAETAELQGKFAQSAAKAERARKLFLRARGYALRALEEFAPGITPQLFAMRDLDKATGRLPKEAVSAMYWAAASWALAISNARQDMEMVAELPAPGALASRALALDETYDEGAIHAFFIPYEASRPTPSAAEAKVHFDRAVALSNGQRLSDFVAWAEGPLVAAQDQAGFVTTLKKVLAADPRQPAARRLANVLAQRRAKQLLQNAADLFN